MTKKNIYNVTFKNGLHNKIKVEAINESEARKEALAAFRKDIYFCDNRHIDEIVDTVVEA